ncbi:protein ITPRID2 isoform X2 [Cyclopterus lumpus]|uniref:protein ITPRID2 isoform X2 n=1 Tax=Cyclopterus lumpus TaxID=8103 RepID=UPI0014864983|nr:protein ITPRID2 isoform X2 [Cyclopterus lumpus]
MESPSSTVRRRAWINSSRQQTTLEELDPDGPLCNLPSASIADDDVFSDGCFTGKIENWLLGCGSKKNGQLSFESVKPSNFDDELSLGADATLINVGESTSEARIGQHPSPKKGPSRLTSTPRQQLCPPSLNLGHSMASSCLSSSTSTSTSSVSEILQLCSEDAEETLYELGFGRDEPQVTVRIPPRFFTFPSLSQGINFRLFLDSQLRRIREEDHSLTLASRFRQVQVLTAMANAFYSLYSHVSRTPLQKLAPPECTFSSSSVERIERFRSNIRSEPRSPVERLKDTVSKMCLYTGSLRGSDSTSPQPSPGKRPSLPDVVSIVLEKVKTGATKKLDLGVNDSKSAVDVRLVTDDDESWHSGKEEQTQRTAADTDLLQNGNTILHKEMQGTKQTDKADGDENGVKPGELARRTRREGTSLASSLSGETVIETDHQFISTQSDTMTADLKPVAKLTYDLICPQIVERVHQALFCCRDTHGAKTNTSPPISSETWSIDRSCLGSHKPDVQTAFSESDARQLGGSRSLPVLAFNGSNARCCITVTGWEGDDVSSTVPPVQSFNGGKSRYLNPQTHQGLGHNSKNLQQVNSFELEEVHSAGEDDFGQLETIKTTTCQLSKEHQYKGTFIFYYYFCEFNVI